MKLSEAIEKYGDCEVKAELIDLIDTKSKTIYDLRNGDRYYCLSSYGGIITHTFENEKFDKACFNIGNVFLTKGEAEQYKEKLEVEAILKKYSYKFSDDEWEDDCIDKYRIVYDWDSFSVKSVSSCAWKTQGVIYFKNENDANRAILKVGKDRLIKYLKAN